MESIKKILVVDDSRMMRSIIKEMVLEIEELNCEIVDVPNGEEAEKEISTNKDFDLLLLDWNMPKLNGVELLIRIKKMELPKVPKIIMITSESAKYNMIEAMEQGTDSYLIKPIEKDDLINAINDIYKNK